MKIKKGLKIRTIADENVLIVQSADENAETTKVVSFNDTAKWLWDELRDKDFSLYDVSRLLAANFNIDDACAESDAEKWIDKLSACDALES